MKSIGIVRKVDDLGRIVLPRELRRVFEINEGDPVEIYVDGVNIILKKYNPGCICCKSVENLEVVQGVRLCGECIDLIVARRK